MSQQGMRTFSTRAVLLASALERAPPQVADVMLKDAQGCDVGGHGMVIIPTDDHPFQPASLLGDVRVPMPPKLLLDLAQLGAHPVAPRTVTVNPVKP